MLSCVWLFVTLRSLPGSSVHTFSKQQCWRELPFHSLGDLPDPGIKAGFPALEGRFFTIWGTRKALLLLFFFFYAFKHKVNKSPSSQGYGFSSSHVWVWELDYKESWAPKNWCFWIVVLEKTLESPLDCKEIQPVHPKGDQSWVSIGRTDVEAETPILWPPNAKRWLIWKDPDAGKDWGQEEKGTTEDEMVRCHHRSNRHGFGWTPGVGDGQGGLVCCGPWGHKELDTTGQLNWSIMFH